MSPVVNESPPMPLLALVGEGVGVDQNVVGGKRTVVVVVSPVGRNHECRMSTKMTSKKRTRIGEGGVGGGVRGEEG